MVLVFSLSVLAFSPPVLAFTLQSPGNGPRDASVLHLNSRFKGTRKRTGRGTLERERRREKGRGRRLLLPKDQVGPLGPSSQGQSRSRRVVVSGVVSPVDPTPTEYRAPRSESGHWTSVAISTLDPSSHRVLILNSSFSKYGPYTTSSAQ